jgi:hypothetical protein
MVSTPHIAMVGLQINVGKPPLWNGKPIRNRGNGVAPRRGIPIRLGTKAKQHAELASFKALGKITWNDQRLDAKAIVEPWGFKFGEFLS